MPRPTSFVAARSRPGDDDTLIRIWAPSSASSCGTAEVPEVLADRRCPIPTPSRDGTARSTSPGREEAPLVEQPVRRQEHLAVDVPDLAVLEQRGRDEQAVVGRLLDERDDGRQAARSRRPARPGAGRPAASRPRRRGPGAGSRSARAPGRPRGPAPSPRASASSAWWRSRFASRSPEARRDLGEGDRSDGCMARAYAAASRGREDGRRTLRPSPEVAAGDPSRVTRASDAVDGSSVPRPIRPARTR